MTFASEITPHKETEFTAHTSQTRENTDTDRKRLIEREANSAHIDPYIEIFLFYCFLLSYSDK
jgi:hypothetical protein